MLLINIEFKPLNQTNMKSLALIAMGIIIGTCLTAIIAANSPHWDMKEYQIRLELNEAYIYSEGELIGTCPHGSDGIDSVLLMDNL